jgi:RHS repeat-associated protein
VDARTAKFYDGDPGGFSRGGHLPGALSIPFPSLLEPEPFTKLLDTAALAEVFRAAGVEPGAVVHYYFANHLGSASVVTSSTGVIQDESDFYPFGGERVVTDTDPNAYKFTGKEWDTESGLDFFIARYYSSGYGRFLSPDLPFADQEKENPQSWNLYSYVQNNPLVSIDPNGRGTVSFLFKVAKAAWKGESVRAQISAVKQQVSTVFDSSKPLADRLEAVGGALSEVALPVSIQDGKDLGELGGELVSKVDEVGGATALISKGKNAFTIKDWTGYPEGQPKPDGELRVVEGKEYENARKQANTANQQLHQDNPSFKGQQIHEIKPVKFGGSPTATANKVVLPLTEHRKATSFWSKILEKVKKVAD